MASTVMCSQCKSDTNIDNVRYADNGRDLVCVVCFDKMPSKMRKPVLDREKFHCLGCNYKFSYKKDSKVKRRCPYCSSENVALADSINAENVLQDVTLNPEFAFER